MRSGGVQHVRHETAQADGQADARVLAVALRGEVVVTAAGADRAKRRRPVEEGLVYGTGVVVESTGDLQVGDHRARADEGGFVDDHRERVQSLPGQHVRGGIGRDAVRGAQRVELVGELLAVGGGEFGQFQAGAGLRFIGAARVDEQLRHFVRADLVELVDLAKHSLDVGQAKSAVEAFGQLAVVRVHGRLG